MSQEMLIGQILRALANHSELITHAYTQGRVQTESSTNIQLLVNSGLLQGNTSDGFRLVAPLRDMLDLVIQREKRRIKALDVAAWREQVIHLVEQYTNALQEDRHDDAQFHFQSLRDEIYTLSDSMSDQTHLLGLKLENEFGYVSTMAEKRRENAQLLKQAERLMDAMSIVSHDDLDEWGASHFELRQLLNSELDRHIFAARERLNLILPRLRHKLFGQSIPDQQTALVKKWQSYLFRHPEYVPDFVVETNDYVLMVETKSTQHRKDDGSWNDEVTEKAKSGVKWCVNASAYLKGNGGKEWKYLLIPHDEVKENFDMSLYVNRFEV